MGLTLGLVLAILSFLIIVLIIRYFSYKETLNQIDVMVAQGQCIYPNQNQNYNTINRNNNSSDRQNIPPKYEEAIQKSRPPSYESTDSQV